MSLAKRIEELEKELDNGKAKIYLYEDLGNGNIKQFIEKDNEPLKKIEVVMKMSDFKPIKNSIVIKLPTDGLKWCE